jgi:RNA polymerase sigma factor (sigma-70 family)
MALPLTDSALLRGLQAVDAPGAMWHRFYDTYRHVVIGWCRRSGLEKDQDAEDVLQAAMTKIFCNLHTYDQQKGRFGPWIKTIVMNEIRDRFRRAAMDGPERGVGGTTNQHIVNNLEVPGEQKLENESKVADVFRRTSQQVSEGSWNMFIRCKFLGQDAESVARDFNIRRASVYQNVSRITKLLRQECEAALWSDLDPQIKDKSDETQ